MRRTDPRWWLRLEHEASSCPACASPRITLLDVFPIPRAPDGHSVRFLTGCHACGLLFANPLPSVEELHRYYSDEGPWAARRAERMNMIKEANLRRLRRETPRPKTSIPPRPRSLLDALVPYVPVYEPPPGAKVLDFGCGDGKFLNRLQDYGWETYGIEPSTSAAFPRHGHLTSPPQDGRFDFVFLNHVLEHVTTPLDLLRQLAGALREGGVLFVSVPRLDTLPVHGDFAYCISGRRHAVCFSETCLRGLLARAGFATAGRLDANELDAAFTEGKPLRLRLVAVRTRCPDHVPDTPLAPALEALARYARAHAGLAARVRRLLPVRVRGTLLERAAERRALDRKRALLETSGRQRTGG